MSGTGSIYEYPRKYTQKNSDQTSVKQGLYGTGKGDFKINIEEERNKIENLYDDGGFGEILCTELHYGNGGNGLHFKCLAKKWNISLEILGLLIYDHCKRL